MTWRALAMLTILFAIRGTVHSQGLNKPDSLRSYAFVGVSGFLPLREAYRINYSTSVVGTPFELQAGIGFPASPKISVPLVLRYTHREANFIANTDVTTWSLEPGVRLQLENPAPNELSFNAGTALLLTRSTVRSEIERTTDGTSPTLQSVQKDYYNLGLALDLGLNYPIARISALELLLHVGILFGDPASHGGLGNTGGVSVGVAYKIYF